MNGPDEIGSCAICRYTPLYRRTIWKQRLYRNLPSAVLTEEVGSSSVGKWERYATFEYRSVRNNYAIITECPQCGGELHSVGAA